MTGDDAFFRLMVGSVGGIKDFESVYRNDNKYIIYPLMRKLFIAMWNVCSRRQIHRQHERMLRSIFYSFFLLITVRVHTTKSKMQILQFCITKIGELLLCNLRMIRAKSALMNEFSPSWWRRLLHSSILAMPFLILGVVS